MKEEGQINLRAIDDHTPTEEIIEALDCMRGSLNHEDENCDKAIKQAIKRLEATL